MPRQIASSGRPSCSARSVTSISSRSRAVDTPSTVGCGGSSVKRAGAMSPPPVSRTPSRRDQSTAGARMLNGGGNAVDAGVAAGICLGVVHVDMVSVAGVAPILVHLAQSRETWQVTGVGPYPAVSTPEYFHSRHGGQIPPGLGRTV